MRPSRLKEGREIRDEVRSILKEWQEDMNDRLLIERITSYCIRLRNLAFMDAQPTPLRDHLNRECRRNFWIGWALGAVGGIIAAVVYRLK